MTWAGTPRLEPVEEFARETASFRLCRVRDTQAVWYLPAILYTK